MNTEYSREILNLIDEMPIKELFVKLELLNWQEQNVHEIQGLLTGGSISLSGDSSVRRTCTLNFLVPDDQQIEEYIQLNSKFRLAIGLKNRLPIQYKSLGDVLWFKAGLYVFTDASFTHNASSVTVNVTAKDKMCLLNGDVAGVIPDTVIFHEYEETDEDGNITYVQILIFNLIKELVNHYGEEAIHRIFINDVPLQVRQLMQYNGNRPLYMEYDNPNKKNVYTGSYTFTEGEAATYPNGYKMFTVGEAIGYTLTDFTFPGELISSPGDTVCTILDKIKNVLGNFEYYYDIDGNFIFQEIRNYLNNSYIPLTEVSTDVYQANFDIEETVYSFKENRKLISSFSNNPNYGNIKNDFVVWGMRKGALDAELPIRYHLAIDDKPLKTADNPSDEWRERLYQYVMSGHEAALDMGYYEKEMKAEWRKLYDPDNGGWNPDVDNDSASLDFFLDFIDTNSEYGKWSVKNIGRRTIAVVDDDCTCVYTNEIPDVVFTTPDKTEELLKQGYIPAQVDDQFFDLIRISGNNKSCFDRMRELMYEHLTLNETINLTALPIYWLEPNTKIEVEDNKSRIYGQYMIKSISLPLTYNGTMNITAVRALSRI